jgi:hypothetical protein
MHASLPAGLFIANGGRGMSSRIVICSLLILAFPSFLPAQTHSASEPRAIALAAQSIAVLTHGAAISDVRLTADFTWLPGPEPERGTGVLLAKGTSESRIEVSVNSGGTRTEIRNSFDGPAGKWVNPDGKSGKYALHNCWTDAAWFFPALSSLANSADPRLVFSYVGEVTWNGLSARQLRVYQAEQASKEAQRLSPTDFYLDPTSLLVLGIAYMTHPDNNMDVDLLSEVRFADYQSVNGVEVPFYIQHLQNGAVLMDITVTNASFNTGLSEDTFATRQPHTIQSE